MKNNHSENKLLPLYFKKIALSILVFSIIFVLLGAFKIIHIEKETAKAIGTTGLLLSCLIFAVTKNKIENDATLILRYKALSFSVLFVTLFTIITPFINLISEGKFEVSVKVTQVFFMLFGYYFLIFYSMLRRSK